MTSGNSFFEYENGICTINIAEYDYPKSEFNLKDERELKEFIETIDVLYDLCDNDRIQYDNDANIEYYIREKIVSLIQEELNNQDRELNFNENTAVEHDKILTKIELLNKLKEEINEILN